MHRQLVLRYAVVPCNACQRAWSVETRHRTSHCPDCGAKADLRRRNRLWEGDDANDARAVVAKLRAGGQIPQRDLERPAPRHDDALDAAASKGRSIRNASKRAEEVALWLCRLEEQPSHGRLAEALVRAGLTAERAEKEIVRMLVADHIYEPRAGQYDTL